MIVATSVRVSRVAVNRPGRPREMEAFVPCTTVDTGSVAKTDRLPYICSASTGTVATVPPRSAGVMMVLSSANRRTAPAVLITPVLASIRSGWLVTRPPVTESSTPSVPRVLLSWIRRATSPVTGCPSACSSSATRRACVSVMSPRRQTSSILGGVRGSVAARRRAAAFCA